MKRATRFERAQPASGLQPAVGLRPPRRHAEGVALDDLWRDRAAAIVFLRHYLCVQCRVGSMELERDRPKRRPEQDWRQLGGAFVFAPGGRLGWSHRARHAGDDAGAQALAAAPRGAGTSPLPDLEAPTRTPAAGRKEV